MQPRTPLILIVALLATVSLSVAAAETPTTPGFSEQSNFCEGTYALCIRALCAPIPTQPRLVNYTVDHALCTCEVVEGWSMGPGACADRAPVVENGRTFLTSTYSNRFNDTHSTLSCDSESQTWAWCYGAPCVVDANDPKKATCTCPLEVGPSRTLGGDCKTSACDLIWSAATPSGDVFANAHFFDWMKNNHPQYPANPPAPACPASSDDGMEAMGGSDGMNGMNGGR